MNKDLLELIKKIQPQIVSILLVRGDITLIDRKGKLMFNNIKIKQSALAKGLTIVTDEMANNYVQLWPKGYRSSISAVKSKMERFMIEHNCTIEQINNSAKTWIREKGTPFHGKADFFFYKLENGVETSRCEEYLDLDNNEPEEEDYRTKVT